MKRLIIVFGLLWVTCPLFAAVELDALDSYDNFVIKKEMWVCTSIAFPVDISYDAFEVDFRTVAQGRYGHFVQVRPGAYKDGSVDFADVSEDVIIQNPFKGALNVVGKPAGVYEYVFISTADDGFCGMGKGEKAVVRVYLVPQPTSFPVLTNVCPGSTEYIDFNNFIPPEVKYFIDEMGWKVTFTTLDGQKVEMPVSAGLANVGDNVYKYTYDDSEGEFSGKYTQMHQDAIYCCPEDSAYLTHTVRIREDEEYAIPDKSISFCPEVLSLVPETKDSLNTNLFGYLGSSAPDGVWSIEDYGGLNASEFTINTPNEGDVKIPVSMIIAMNVKEIAFKYSYKDCMQNDTFTLLTFNFDSETFEKIFDQGEDQEHDVCRNLMSGVVELSSIFGFNVPLTSGIWYQKEDDEFKEMLYGAVDISDMQSGSLYTFRYDVNSAVDEICGIQEKSTEFRLRMHDLEVANAEARICKQQFKDGITVDLSRYVPGLNNTDRISPDRITWKDVNGNPIANEGWKNYELKSTADWQTADTSTYKMLFQYDVRSDCGLYTGNLYISAVDSIGSDTARTVIVCYTDEYAKHVDLFQVLGVVGADGNNGKFRACDVPDGKDLSSVEETGIMNAFELFDTTQESETYTFCYQSINNSCVSSKMEVTVIVTRDVNKEVETIKEQ